MVISNSPPAPLIELDRVRLVRDGTEILRDVDWTVHGGSRWAVLGPNGSGKSTLLRVACGYLWPTEGVVRRLGQELIDLRVMRRSIGWVAADLAARIPADEVAIRTVVSGRFALLGLHGGGELQPAARDFTDAGRILAAMGCDALAEKRFGILSQGEKQQVLVARARMAEPLLIVVDEPCAGMDPGNRERFLGWLDGIASQEGGPAIIFVTHHVEEIMPSFTSTLMLSGGRILDQGPTERVVGKRSLEQLYGVGIRRLEHADGRTWPLWCRGAS